MTDTKAWKVCFEIGLNHLGRYENIMAIINDAEIPQLPCAISIQIREDSFYADGRQDFTLRSSEYSELRKLCAGLQIPFGLALGPLEDLTWLASLNLEPDFIKFLSVASNDIEFVDRLNKVFHCPKYYSVGLSNYSYIQEHLVSRMRNQDMLIHTSLSHASCDQNLGDISKLASFGRPVCFGLHARELEVCFAAIGAGAEKIFIYIGDKGLPIPDKEHAISTVDAKFFYNKAAECFAAMDKVAKKKKQPKIKFIG